MSRRSWSVVTAIVLALSMSACSGGGSADDGGLHGRLLPRGGRALVGPASGTGPRALGHYQLRQDESVGVAIICSGRGWVHLGLSGTSAGPRIGCGGTGEGAVGGGGVWRVTAASSGTARVVAERGTRWRVALYRAPYPLPPGDDDPALTLNR